MACTAERPSPDDAAHADEEEGDHCGNCCLHPSDPCSAVHWDYCTSCILRDAGVSGGRQGWREIMGEVVSRVRCSLLLPHLCDIYLAASVKRQEIKFALHCRCPHTIHGRHMPTVLALLKSENEMQSSFFYFLVLSNFYWQLY